MLSVKIGIISVQDIDRAITFYTEKLGFKRHTDEKFGDNHRWVELSIPNCDVKIAFTNFSDAPFQPAPCSNIIFGSDDVEAEYRQLVARGVEFTQPPKKESWGTSALFKDSEGNVFCIGSNDCVHTNQEK